ncbi:AAA family ATPase [Bradyrhizobium sp. AUGA SZCCT0240]|uniref:BTAD domain-containing putative transcriptional regulator n=1 Tax=Bradyrhizobium sp. AUGA SZCCT0240 TaxID=2807669 RepID=UPI001BAD34E8|nr:BTAD domain-containing putative transcriptional regulator [Bradyrhizobium sp. AUGA SZCCT0240]MBR1253455.1 AAA family ATPase [Bradyrhizobium sp. AUGA SZCCT0240]
MDGASSPIFHLSLLGGFELTGPLGVVDLPSKKLAGLLAYLACNAPRPQSREKLSALLWGSHFDAQAKQNLRQALFRLRKVLGEDALESDGEVVSLNPAAVRCDVGWFEALVRDGSRDALSAAADLYRGRLIDDVTVGEERWNEWLTAERERLLELALGAMVGLGEQELAAGRAEQALKAGQRAIVLNDMREDAHRLIVRALAATGRKAEALKHYQDLVALLRRELNTEPDAATRSLVAGLRSTQSASGSPAVREIANPPLPAVTELPIADMRDNPEQEIGAESAIPLSNSPSAAAAFGSGSSERRQLTIMACNIVDSMALSARLDPEHMRELVTAFHEAIDDVVSRFDGFVAQYLGDGALVYFGYPAADEHDTEQAVRAGLAILDTVRTLKAGSGVPLQARIGIATGLVVVGEQLGTGDIAKRVAIGGTPNLAARLQAAAPPGEVVIAASTWRLVGRMFDCHALAAIDMEGLPQPVEAWQVRGEAAGVSRFEARRSRAQSALVGRQEEIELLLRRWDQAKLGEGRVVLLSGEPGIGKSRISETLLVRLEGEPHARLRYFCSPHHTQSPLYPLITQLEQAAGFEPGSDPSAKFDKLEALLRPTAKNLRRDVALIAELLGVPADERYSAPEVGPQQKREMTLTAILDQLVGAAAQGAVLILVEDAHWIDPTSQDLLERMVARAAGLPVLLVVTGRPELRPNWVGEPHVSMLPLNRLGRRDSAGIIAGVARDKALPDAVVDQVLARADGVPLFIEELTSALIESGVLRETDEGYALDGPLPELAIPATLQASLVARLDRLAAVKDVAQIGAAIGREFSHEMIAAVSAMTPIDLDAALERLTASGLIFRSGSPPIATYSFKHALVQDAAYATLVKNRRQLLHARIVKALEDRLPETAVSQPEILAHHCAEALLVEPAIGYWQKAGERALRGAAMIEAVKHLTHGMNLIPRLPAGPARDRKELGVCLALARATYSVKGPCEETLRLFSRARDLLDESATLDERMSALTGLWRVESNRGRHVAARELARQSVAAVVHCQSDEMLGRANLSTGVTLCWMGMFAEARRCLEQAIDQYAVGREPTTNVTLFGAGNAQSILGLTLWPLGYPEQALQASAHGLSIARESGHAAAVSIALVSAAQLEAAVASCSEAAHVDEAVAHCAKHYKAYEPWARFYSGILMSRRGDPRDGIEVMQAAKTAEREFDVKLGAAMRLGHLATAHASVGALDGSLDLLDQAIMMVEKTQERLFEAELHRRRGEVLLELGMTGDGESALLRALVVARNQHARMWELRAATSLARLWDKRGRRAEARELLAPVYSWFTEGFDMRDLIEAKVLLGDLA